MKALAFVIQVTLEITTCRMPPFNAQHTQAGLCICTLACSFMCASTCRLWIEVFIVRFAHVCLPSHLESFHTVAHTHITSTCFISECFCVFQCQSYLGAGLVLSLSTRAALTLHLSTRQHFISVQGVHAGSRGAR